MVVVSTPDGGGKCISIALTLLTTALLAAYFVQAGNHGVQDGPWRIRGWCPGTVWYPE